MGAMERGWQCREQSKAHAHTAGIGLPQGRTRGSQIRAWGVLGPCWACKLHFAAPCDSNHNSVCVVGAMHAEYDEFAVALDSCDEEWGPVAGEAGLPSKRRNAGATPERFRGGPGLSTAPPPPTAAAGVAAAAVGVPPGPALGHGSSQRALRPGNWNVRSIFLGTASQQPQQAPPGAPPAQLDSSPPLCGLKQPSVPQQQRSPLPSAARGPPRSPLGLGAGYHEQDENAAGPLTQMAAANAPVAAAFCPHCGCFLADLGSAAQQQRHAASCSQSAAGDSAWGQPAAGAAVRQPQGLDVAAAAGPRGSPGEEGCWEDEGQDGDWSEQEEATQGVAGGGEAPAAADDDDDGQEEAEEGAEEEAEVAAEEAAGAGDQPEGGGMGEHAALAAFLDQHGLAKYCELFVRAGGWPQLRLPNRPFFQPTIFSGTPRMLTCWPGSARLLRCVLALPPSQAPACRCCPA